MPRRAARNNPTDASGARTVIGLAVLIAAAAYLLSTAPTDDPEDLLVQPVPFPEDWEHSAEVRDTFIMQMRALGFPRFGLAGSTIEQNNADIASVLRTQGINLNPQAGPVMAIQTVDRVYRQQILRQGT